MKQKFLDLYKKLKKNPVNSISGINAKLPNFSPEAMTLLLYPALEDKNDHLNIENAKFDQNKIRELSEIFVKYSGRDFVRIFLFGTDISYAFKRIREAGLVYEDEYNQLVISAEEIQFTFRGDIKKINNIIKNYLLFALAIEKYDVNCYLGQLSDNEVDVSKINKYRYDKAFNISRENPYLFMMLLNHKGPIHHELTFLTAMSFLEKKHHEQFIANANSKFVLTYLQEFATIHAQSINGLLRRINTLLDHFDFNVLANYSLKEVNSKFYTMIRKF